MSKLWCQMVCWLQEAVWIARNRFITVCCRVVAYSKCRGSALHPECYVFAGQQARHASAETGEENASISQYQMAQLTGVRAHFNKTQDVFFISSTTPLQTNWSDHLFFMSQQGDNNVRFTYISLPSRFGSNQYFWAMDPERFLGKKITDDQIFYPLC